MPGGTVPVRLFMLNACQLAQLLRNCSAERVVVHQDQSSRTQQTDFDKPRSTNKPSPQQSSGLKRSPKIDIDAKFEEMTSRVSKLDQTIWN
jgi:hypothetical protein